VNGNDTVFLNSFTSVPATRTLSEPLRNAIRAGTRDFPDRLIVLSMVADAEIEKVFPALQRVVVTIHTSDGRQLTRQLDYPKGDPRNPLSDREIEEKFDALGGPVLSAAARAKVKDTVWNLEKLGTVTDLMRMLKAKKPR